MIDIAEDIRSTAAIFDMLKGINFDICADKVERVSKVDRGDHLEGLIKFIEGRGGRGRIKGGRIRGRIRFRDDGFFDIVFDICEEFICIFVKGDFFEDIDGGVWRVMFGDEEGCAKATGAKFTEDVIRFFKERLIGDEFGDVFFFKRREWSGWLLWGGG